jgi:hypothetical protein
MDDNAYEGDTVELRCDAPEGDPMPSVIRQHINQNLKKD